MNCAKNNPATIKNKNERVGLLINSGSAKIKKINIAVENAQMLMYEI